MVQSETIDKSQNGDSQKFASFSGKYFYGVGRRKTAVAEVRLYIEQDKDKRGKIVVNGKDYKTYFSLFDLRKTVEGPLKVAGLEMEFAISAKTQGGGIRGQAESIALGIARALLKMNPELRPTLKPHHMLTRDPRRKERKKPGLKRARRAPQWQKR